jgi:hypothetical protein
VFVNVCSISSVIGFSGVSKPFPMNSYVSRKCKPNLVPKMLIFEHKAQHVAVSTEHLHQLLLEGNTFPK